MIAAVGVAIPARDEAALIGPCLRRLRVALAELPARIERAVCVVADRCTDHTAALARTEFAGWGNALVLANERDVALGEVRDLGFRRVAAMLGGHERGHTLLLSTDADTEVEPDWARAHLRLAEQGWHGIAGVAELAGPLPAAVAARYACVRDAGGNVYGANLGVRADAYTAVGGFAPLATGEDRDLWRRLGAAGFRRIYATEPVVHTSSRQHGRARDGVAALLRRLHDDDLPTAG
ncbi:MAG TPA: glycosyltransferase [Pseudonocardiaceae bacterium]|nr:glycosyltransferase [Pseudonocardiaceae bacterium]